METSTSQDLVAYLATPQGLAQDEVYAQMLSRFTGVVVSAPIELAQDPAVVVVEDANIFALLYSMANGQAKLTPSTADVALMEKGTHLVLPFGIFADAPQDGFFALGASILMGHTIAELDIQDITTLPTGLNRVDQGTVA